MNYLSGQNLSLVSSVPGTTTDPVQKNAEIPPLGPVVLIDSAGLDDEGELGSLRVQKSLENMPAMHLALLVSDGQWGSFEEWLLNKLKELHIPCLVVWSKSDSTAPSFESEAILLKNNIPSVRVSSTAQTGLRELVAAIVSLMPEQALVPPSLLDGVLSGRDLTGSMILFVMPIDASAPKGRLIAPQVLALRNALDTHALSLVVQVEELPGALQSLRTPPSLVVCDTQVVHRCAEYLPPDVPLTTFSILMARLKGDLPTLASGAAAMHSLRKGDRVCIAEVCTHHSQPDDIGRVQIPALLRKFTGVELDIVFSAGVDYPEDIDTFKLIIHCGGCMINRPLMLSRMAKAGLAGVPITNYGVAISLMRGVLESALGIFPEALQAYTVARNTLKCPS